MAVHGVFLVLVYFGSFFLMVSLGSRFDFQTFWGDVAIEFSNFRIYLPFTSSLAFSIFSVIMFSVYRSVKS